MTISELASEGIMVVLEAWEDDIAIEPVTGQIIVSGKTLTQLGGVGTVKRYHVCRLCRWRNLPVPLRVFRCDYLPVS